MRMCGRLWLPRVSLSGCVGTTVIVYSVIDLHLLIILRFGVRYLSVVHIAKKWTQSFFFQRVMDYIYKKKKAQRVTWVWLSVLALAAWRVGLSRAPSSFGDPRDCSLECRPDGLPAWLAGWCFRGLLVMLLHCCVCLLTMS